MRGDTLPWTLILLVWVLCLPPPASSTSTPSPHTPLTPQTLTASPRALPPTPEGHEEEVAPGSLGSSPAPLLPLTSTEEEEYQDVARLSPPSTSTSTSTYSSSTTDDASTHRHRHHHAAAPPWLKDHLDAPSTTMRRSTSRGFEDDIAAVFLGVAYGGSTSYRSVPYRKQRTREVKAAPRIERTTAGIEEPLNDDPEDGITLEETRMEEEMKELLPSSTKGEESVKGNETLVQDLDVLNTTTEGWQNNTLGSPDPDPELKTDLPSSHQPEVTETAEVTSVPSTKGTEVPPTTTHAPRHAPPLRPPSPRLSWLDVLRCTHQGLAWVLVNFFLGLLLLTLSLLGPYRLLTMRSCTPLLPRTHYVAVHLLVFVAASLKAVYLFHLAFGSRGRLPLVLLLLLTNTGFPCLSSAFLVLMMMMFVAADVQVYKSKVMTAHNTFIFLVVMLVLGFIADVIVGGAHSRSVLVLSRVMVIGVALVGMMVFVRKQQAVVAVSDMMKREFQGEMKLLVLPAKDDSLQRQMGIKHILRNRLGLWCRAVRVCAGGLTLLSLIHLLHTIFLVSSHVPAWAWWLFHISGCLVEALLAVSTCVAAALTQRYDESVSFVFSFMVPPVLVRRKGASTVPSEPVVPSGDPETIYQRVSFSSGTESTQYTACCPDGGVTLAGTPQAPKRRGAPVKRSATFSHTPHLPHTSPHLYGNAPNPMQVARVGSASNLPLYGPSLARRPMYGPGMPLHTHMYSPSTDGSVLVHEDGFVRVRTPMELRDAPPPRPHGSLILLQQAHFQGSSPQLREAPPRQETLYQSLSRQRKRSQPPDVLQNNINASESDYHSSPSSRMSYGWHSNLASPHSPVRDEPDYYTLSRRAGPGTSQDQVNYDSNSLSWRRRSYRDKQDSYMNNLDRPEGDYSRQVSREDNNDPIHHHYPDHYSSRRSSRDARSPSLNVYEEQASRSRPSTLGGSPGMTFKVSNRSFSPSSPSTPPAGHVSCTAESPRFRRQARFPKPFVRVGSNRSLQGEDLYNGEYVARGNPVRRNHSSAGYYPSRYMAPSTPSLVEAQRYGSLRLARTRKRHPLYSFSPDGKLLNHHPEEWMKAGRTRTPDNQQNGPEGAEGEEAGAGPPRDCPSRQSTSSKRSDGKDQDWATELIKSSSMLTDFYSLSMEKKKAKRKEKEKEKEKEILEEQEQEQEQEE